MSEEVKKEQTKAATQDKTTELTDAQLDEAAGGVKKTIQQKSAFEDVTRSLGLG